MKKNKIKSVEEALQLFEDCTIKRGVAIDADDVKTYNKLLPTVYNCIVYLYDNQQLNLLYKFLKHNNSYVRSFAAYALLPLFENECVKVLHEIANGNYGIQGLNAETTLMMWRDGELKFPYQTNSGKKSVSQKEDKHSIEVSNKNEEHLKDEDFSPETLWLSQIFECPPTSDNDLRNEQAEFYVSFEPTKQEIEIRVNTFVNPYTQDVNRMYQDRLNRFKAFEHIATISADKPSKLGFMQIRLAIPEDKADDDTLIQIKNTINNIYSEWKPNETLVCFKAEYNGAICYFEGEWWCPTRAVIMGRNEYERYDFSDEMKYDEAMWDIVQGEYDALEDSDSFALINCEEFQLIWDNTKHQYIPKPY